MKTLSSALGYFLIVCLMLSCIVAFAHDGSQDKHRVTIYFYHLKPPFVTDLGAEQGLYFDLVELLNQQDTYLFEAIYIPRKRVDRIITAPDFSDVLLGINPVWFGDAQQEKYRWTQDFYLDHDHIVYNQEKPVSYQSADSLVGKTVAVARGHFYKPLEAAFVNRDIVKVESSDEVAVMDMVKLGRVDAGVVSVSTFNYLVKRDAELGDLRLSDVAIDSFGRKLLTGKQQDKLQRVLSEKLDTILTSSEWQKITAYYGR